MLRDYPVKSPQYSSSMFTENFFNTCVVTCDLRSCHPLNGIPQYTEDFGLYAYRTMKFSHHSTPTVETDAGSADCSDTECEEKLVLL